MSLSIVAAKDVDQAPDIRAFADSMLKWLSEHEVEENSVIQQYGASFKKIRSFAVALERVCDAAVERGYGLIGIGD